MGLRTRRQGATRATSFMRRGIAFAMASGACVFDSLEVAGLSVGKFRA